MAYSLARRTKLTPDQERALAAEKCDATTDPMKAPAGSLCPVSVICQRCNRCVGHCTCPPIEMRFKKRSTKKGGSDGKG